MHPAIQNVVVVVMMISVYNRSNSHSKKGIYMAGNRKVAENLIENS